MDFYNQKVYGDTSITDGLVNFTLSLSQFQDRDTKFILRTRAKSPFAGNQFPGDYRLLLLVGYILVFSGQHSVVPIL